MSNTRANTKFWIIAGVVLTGSVIGLAALWPVALSLARSESVQLTKEAAAAQGTEATTDYHLAVWLNPANQPAYLGLARTEIAADHTDEALQALDHAGEGSEAARLRVRIDLELGRYHDGAQAADTLAKATDRTEGDIVFTALAYGLDGRTADIKPLMPLVASPDALRRIQRAEAQHYALAAELYSSGLLNSSSALLAKEPAGYERNLLLARICYERHTPASLASAADLLTAANTLNPANLDARRLLVQIYQAQKNSSAADQQNILIAKLVAGRP